MQVGGKRRLKALPILAVLAGFFCALLVKQGGFMAIASKSANTLELDARVKRLIADNDVLTQRVNELTKELLKYEEIRFSGEETTRYLQEQLEAVRIQAGLTTVEGEGVRIVVKDRVGSDGVSQVTDEDLLSIVNELNASGAEAICVSGERIVSTTEIRRAGEYISINARHYTAPFEVLAIGNAQTLNGAMYLYGGVVERLSRWVDISIEISDTVRIPAYRQWE